MQRVQKFRVVCVRKMCGTQRVNLGQDPATPLRFTTMTTPRPHGERE